ncbi:YfdX family protein [Rhodobium gokarnense]|uniref:YfdX protein n=1 Tax=Rhodobium gokarnense TaxID=364296 RepID=A0ABT3HIC8_9HYPH|nr:YfdX family protein [Rhodobium gokarnense]MCW2310054.1 hypothetical protein [Rhodobium gokarnense]
MKTRRNMTAVALAGALAALPVIAATAGYAADQKAAEATTKAAGADAVAAALDTKDKKIIKTVDEAYRGVREVRAARLAIFNGTPDVATEFVDKAATDLKTAQSSMKDFAVATTKKAAEGDAYLPFDSSLTLAEGFVPTADKAETVKKANEHLAKGDHKKAAEVLREGRIDVTVSAALIPAKASLDHVKDAVKLLGEKKYYEANLALKAVEDSVLVESYSIDGVPQQGSDTTANG